MSTTTKIGTLTARHDAKVTALRMKHTARIEALRMKHAARIAVYESKMNAMIAKLDVRLHVDAQYIRDLEDLNEPAVNTDEEGEDNE